ncbi:MAG: RNA 2',3'-cyclic phosphodiesterase [Candidatus Aenigmatarchaeota archaeon]
MRCFLGVQLNENLLPNVKSIKDEIAETGGDIKLVEDENLHYTIKFLGDIREKDLEKIDKIEQEITDIDPFEIEIKDMGAFPTRDYIKVIWLGVGKGYDRFKKLMTRINDKLESLGFREEKNDLVPHMTIGRVKSGKNKEEIKHKIGNLEDKTIGRMRVERITLFQSNLTPGGPIYEKVKEYKLK